MALPLHVAHSFNRQLEFQSLKIIAVCMDEGHGPKISETANYDQLKSEKPE